MATTDRDYYELLGVARNADDTEIKQAFRRLARELHPDVSDAPNAEARFKEVVEAYEVLSKSETRALYDRYGHAGLRSGGFEPGHVDFGNLADLFRHQGKDEAARSEYRTAAQLAGKDLEVNPGNENLQLWRAVYLAEAGACGDALPWVRRLEASLQPNAENSWIIAQAYAVCDQRAPALEAIRRAVEKGHPPAAIRLQDEFKPLWNDPLIKRLTAAVAPAAGK